MRTFTIVMIVILVILIGVLVGLYIFGKKAEKNRRNSRSRWQRRHKLSACSSSIKETKIKRSGTSADGRRQYAEVSSPYKVPVVKQRSAQRS